MASTMPADMRGGKRAPTATTSKAVGKNLSASILIITFRSYR